MEKLASQREAAAEEPAPEKGALKYTVLAKSTVRDGPDASAEKVGEHKQGTVIDVVEEKLSNAEGLAVVRTSTAPAGWLKMKTSKGKDLLEKQKPGKK